MSEGVIQVAELRAFVERIERMESDIRDLNADKSDVYKELKGRGHDVKTVKKIIADRRMDTHVREEQDALFDMYWEALHGGSHVHARAHVENIEQFPPSSALAPHLPADEKAVPPFNKRGTASSHGQD